MRKTRLNCIALPSLPLKSYGIYLDDLYTSIFEINNSLQLKLHFAVLHDSRQEIISIICWWGEELRKAVQNIINQVKWQKKNKDTTLTNNCTLKKQDGKKFSQKNVESWHIQQAGLLSVATTSFQHFIETNTIPGEQFYTEVTLKTAWELWKEEWPPNRSFLLHQNSLPLEHLIPHRRVS